MIPFTIQAQTEVFKTLTQFTYPHPQYEEVAKEVLEKELKRFGFEDTLRKDPYDNYYVAIGEPQECTTMFAAHLDDVGVTYEPVRHVIRDHIVRTDGNTILGADDKAGVLVLMNLMLHRKPGLYYFFVGEEVGRIGSTYAAHNWKNIFAGHPAMEPYKQALRAVVCFDRKGTSELITHQREERCASDDYAEALCNALKHAHSSIHLKPSPHGLFTDSYSFRNIIEECINVSVGYTHAHSEYEEQDMRYLTALCEAVTHVDWNALPWTRKI